MGKVTRDSLRGLDKYSRDVWRPFLESEFSSIRGKKILDLGCGLCRYTKDLTRNNCVVRVDKVDNPFVDYVCVAEDLPFDDCAFDEVIAIGLLDYSDPFKTVTEIARVLKTDGVARIMVPNITNPYVKMATTFGPHRHVKSAFSEEQIGTILSDKGLVVEKIVMRGFCFWVPSKALQEAFIPIFNDIDSFTDGRFGNNIYMVARKN